MHFLYSQDRVGQAPARGFLNVDSHNQVKQNMKLYGERRAMFCRFGYF